MTDADDTPEDDSPGHASSVAAQLRQAEENDEIPASSADRSSIRLAVDGELLDVDNPIDYLVALLLEGKRYDGAWDGDQEYVAKYAIASWCQEMGWAPDLTGYDPGEVVSLGDEVPYCNAAFYDHAVDEEVATTNIDMAAVDEALEPVDVEAQDIIDEVDGVQEDDDA